MLLPAYGASLLGIIPKDSTFRNPLRASYLPAMIPEEVPTEKEEGRAR